MTNEKFQNTVRLWWHLQVANRVIFFRESMRHWMEIGSAFPTGTPWRRKALAASFAHCPKAELVVIHGIGCGELLVSMLAHIRRHNLRVGEILIMDTNPQFISRAKKLSMLMRDLNRCGTKIRFACMDAMGTEAYLQDKGLPKADIVFGMIPYTNMPEQLDQWVQLYAKIAKRFVCITYVKMVKRSSARRATNRLMDLLQEHFPVVERNLVLSNIPPAYAIVASEKATHGDTTVH